MKPSGDWPQKAKTRMECEGNNMNIEELKLLAEEATPGPWAAAISPNMVNGVFAVFETVCKTGKNIDDALYIAAANPAAILELIRQRDELLAALREIAEWTERYTTPGHPISTAARAVIAKVEK